MAISNKQLLTDNRFAWAESDQQRKEMEVPVMAVTWQWVKMVGRYLTLYLFKDKELPDSVLCLVGETPEVNKSL